MAIGTYVVQNAAGYNDVPGAPRDPATYRSIAMRVSFGQKVTVKSTFVYNVGRTDSNAYVHRFRVFRVSDSAVIHNQTLWLANTASAWEEHPVQGLVLQPNVEYSIGYEVPVGYGTYISVDGSGTGTSPIQGLSTPSGITSSWSGMYYTSNENVMPNSYASDSLNIQLSVSLNEPPTAPTNFTVTNAPVPTGGIPNASWTFNDPNSGDTQSKYQIRWRKKD